jgi:hypothetical protein
LFEALDLTLRLALVFFERRYQFLAVRSFRHLWQRGANFFLGEINVLQRLVKQVFKLFWVLLPWPFPVGAGGTRSRARPLLNYGLSDFISESPSEGGWPVAAAEPGRRALFLRASGRIAACSCR